MLQATIEAVAARRSVTRTTHQQVVEGALEAVRLQREHEAAVDLLPPREEEFRSDVAIRNSVDNLITSLHHMDHGDEPLPPPDEAYTADFSIRPIVEDSEEEAEGSPNAAPGRTMMGRRLGAVKPPAQQLLWVQAQRPRHRVL